MRFQFLLTIAVLLFCNPSLPAIAADECNSTTYPHCYEYYAQQYNFDRAVVSSTSQTTPLSDIEKTNLHEFIDHVIPRFPKGSDAQLAFWWADLEGIFHAQRKYRGQAGWLFSNCGNTHVDFDIGHDCPMGTMWQVGYGVIVNDNLRHLAADLHLLYPDRQPYEIGNEVLSKAGLPQEFPNKPLSRLLSAPREITNGKSNRYWAAVLMRDPLLSAHLAARMEHPWDCYKNKPPKWCVQRTSKKDKRSQRVQWLPSYKDKRTNDSRKMVMIINEWRTYNTR